MYDTLSNPNRNSKSVSQALSINITLVVYCKLLQTIEDFEVWVRFQLGGGNVWEKNVEVKKNKVYLEG